MNETRTLFLHNSDPEGILTKTDLSAAWNIMATLSNLVQRHYYSDMLYDMEVMLALFNEDGGEYSIEFVWQVGEWGTSLTLNNDYDHRENHFRIKIRKDRHQGIMEITPLNEDGEKLLVRAVENCRLRIKWDTAKYIK